MEESAFSVNVIMSNNGGYSRSFSAPSKTWLETLPSPVISVSRRASFSSSAQKLETINEEDSLFCSQDQKDGNRLRQFESLEPDSPSQARCSVNSRFS